VPLVVVWLAKPVFVHTTVSPFVIVTVDGEKKSSPTVIVTLPAKLEAVKRIEIVVQNKRILRVRVILTDI